MNVLRYNRKSYKRGDTIELYCDRFTNGEYQRFTNDTRKFKIKSLTKKGFVLTYRGAEYTQPFPEDFPERLYSSKGYGNWLELSGRNKNKLPRVVNVKVKK